MTMIKVGLIGYGFGGRIFHAPFLTAVPGFELSMIYETKQQNVELIQECYPKARVVSDVEVFGYVDAQRTGCEVTDAFEVILRYPSLKVTLKSSMLVREPSPHYVLYGKSGSFIKYGMDVQEDELIAGKLPVTGQDWGREPEETAGKICTEINGVTIRGTVESERGDYRELYRNVYNAIRGTEDLIVKPEQARDVIRIIELAEQSNEQKRWLRYENGTNEKNDI